MSEAQSAITPLTAVDGGHRLPPPAFSCSCSKSQADTAWVHAVGELDAASAPMLAVALRDSETLGRTVVLDLRDVTFIDIAGVNAIVDASVHALLQGRRLIVGQPAPQVAIVFALIGTFGAVEMVDLHPSEASPRRPLRPVAADGAMN